MKQPPTLQKAKFVSVSSKLSPVATLAISLSGLNQIIMKAKFKISSMHLGTTHGQINAEPVVSGSKENEEFFAAKPSGSLQLGVVNLNAISGLQDGDEIYVTIEKVATPAETEEPVASPGTL